MRLLLVDDHALFRHSLRVLLTSSGYEVVGTAADGLDALEQARTLRPDLVLMDIDMPGCDGLTATRLIKAEYPEMKVVILTVSSSDDHLFEAVRSGACGYLLKSESGERFLEMIGHVAKGGAALSPDLAARVLDEFARQARRMETPVSETRPDLTARQTEILALVAQGLTYAEVAETLFLSEATVRYHLTHAMDRLHLTNRAQVIAYAARHGISSQDPK
jgi:two-component system NarL family response regulator